MHVRLGWESGNFLLCTRIGPCVKGGDRSLKLMIIVGMHSQTMVYFWGRGRQLVMYSCNSQLVLCGEQFVVY